MITFRGYAQRGARFHSTSWFIAEVLVAQREVAQREVAQREVAQREVAQREVAQREVAQREVAQREMGNARGKSRNEQMPGRGTRERAVFRRREGLGATPARGGTAIGTEQALVVSVAAPTPADRDDLPPTICHQAGISRSPSWCDSLLRGCRGRSLLRLRCSLTTLLRLRRV